MIQIEIGKVVPVPRPKFSCRNRNYFWPGPGRDRNQNIFWHWPRLGPNFFLTRTANNTFFIRNDNFYGRVRLLLNVIVSQLMCYKYSSKTLQKPLSREEIVKVVPGSGSKFFFDQNWDGTGLHFSDRDRDGTGPKKVGPAHVSIQSVH